MIALQRLRNTSSSDARLLIRLAEAERCASEAERSKAEFVAHMSHELRTPLNAIIGFSEIIAHGFFGAPGHPKYIEYARDIGSAGRDLHGKIGDILEFANVEAGRYRSRLSPVRGGGDRVGIVSTRLTGCVFSRRIALDFTPSEPVLAHADPSAVRRILTSLLANALAYTPQGGRVRVEVIVEEGAVAVSVSDTGPGLSRRKRPAPATRFAASTALARQTGTGLGLAIAVALAHRTGGALNMASPSGTGDAHGTEIAQGLTVQHTS